MGRNLENWQRIVASLQHVNIMQERDVFVWNLKASGIFTVKSMYVVLINNGERVSQDIWQTKLPMKIKIFMWYLKRGVILTKDNLARRNWHGDKLCCLCHLPETIQHPLIATMPSFCGALFIFFMELFRPLVSMFCLIRGRNKGIKFKHVVINSSISLTVGTVDITE